ncbi:hypothetical protein [Streptomyces sp. NPDC001137]|uniref:hypothetical protein n=1 Tax=Streptomyces sp. NPDC001137 TaxID=3154378 RepID=UPI00331E8EBA
MDTGPGYEGGGAGPVICAGCAGRGASGPPTGKCPALLGDGLRLFDGLGAVRGGLEPVRVVDTPLATHVKYRLVR